MSAFLKLKEELDKKDAPDDRESRTVVAKATNNTN
jgi:hypothetical protein